MTMQLPETEKLIEKLSSKKFFTSLVGMYWIHSIDVPTEYLWVKIVGLTVIAVAEIVFQARLDKDSD
jgi:hypothetical protein